MINLLIFEKIIFNKNKINIFINRKNRNSFIYIYYFFTRVKLLTNAVEERWCND